MLRVLVIGNHSLLAGAIVSSLAPETAMEVLWLTQYEPGKVAEAIYENCSLMIVVEERRSNYAAITANNLLWDYGCFHMIMISSQKHYLHGEAAA